MILRTPLSVNKIMICRSRVVLLRLWPKSGPRTKERSWEDGELESEGRRKATLLG